MYLISYLTNVIASLSLVKKLELEQTVHERPSGKFVSHADRKEYTFCVGDSLVSTDMNSILLNLTGFAPFTVDIGIRHESEIQVHEYRIKGILTEEYELSLPQVELKESGTYFINILSLEDDTGCASRIPTSADTILSIKVLERPTFEPRSILAHVCVGDVDQFGLKDVWSKILV